MRDEMTGNKSRDAFPHPPLG